RSSPRRAASPAEATAGARIPVPRAGSRSRASGATGASPAVRDGRAASAGASTTCALRSGRSRARSDGPRGAASGRASGRPRGRGWDGFGVGAALEPDAGFGPQAEPAGGSADPFRSEVRRLEQDVGGLLPHLALGAAHYPGDRDRTFRVADGHVVLGERSF